MLKVLGRTYEVAENGKEALEKLQSKKYSVVLMDCQMPIMNGFEATRAIRKNEITQGSKFRQSIVALTANAFKETKEDCFESGMDEFITKPVTMKTLELCISNFLQKKS